MSSLLPTPPIGTNTLSPRIYQSEAIDAARGKLRDHRSTLIVLPTGTGKTCVFAMAARMCAEKGGRTLILAHREELINQAASVLERVGLAVGIERADSYARSMYEPHAVVATVQTLRARRLQSWPTDYFKLIVVDEAHHATAPSYRKILDHFARAKVVGVTATPDRADEDEIADVFESTAYEMSIWDAMTAPAPGPYLAPLKFVRCETPVDLRGLKASGEDYNESDLADRITPLVEVLANAIKARVGDRQTLVFTPDCASASAMATALQSIDCKADYVWGDSPDRAEKIERYMRGEARILVNCQIFTEGFDAPYTSAVVLCRPTKSRSLYCLDDQTEVLTEAGWRTREAIREDDRAAAFDLKDGSIHWSPILASVSRTLQPEESMYGIASPSLDIRVTDRHRMVHRTITGRKKVRSGWKVIEAAGLAEIKSSYELPVSGFEDADGLNLTDNQIRFIGWFLTDGGINKTTNQITIYQDQRSPYIGDIKRCLEGCGFKYSVVEETRNTQFSEDSTILRFIVSKGIPRGRDKHLSGWGALEPYIDKAFSPNLDGLSRVQLGILIDEMHKGDGLKRAAVDWRSQTTSICTGSRTMADRLQSLCVRRGYRCNIFEGDWNANPIYILHIKDEQARYVGGCNWADRPTFAGRPYEPFEPVWCVEVDTGAIVTRRNGKVAIVGNCQMVGRGTRLAPGKEDCLVVDFAWLTEKHDLVRPADLIISRSRGDESDAGDVLDELTDAGAVVDLVEAAKQAKEEGAKRRALKIEAKAREDRLKWTQVDPLKGAFDLVGAPIVGSIYDATHARPSERLVAALGKFGVPNADRLSRRNAKVLMERLCERADAGAASLKQVKVLVKNGVPIETARDMSKSEASSRIDEIARKNGWASKPKPEYQLRQGA